jgi:hypothetical protein
MASGGSGSYSWSQVGSDPLPGGLTFDAQGVVSGIPIADGTFQFVVQATSGALTSNPDTVSITITHPVLSQDDVINHLISPVGTLTPDEERYLDIIGNNNGRYDIGDFRAYLQESGVIADIAPADLLKAGDKARKED